MAKHWRGFVLVLAGVSLVYGLIDFADRSSAYTGPGWPLWVARLYADRLLKVATLLSPVACLIAGGLTISGLRRRSEWVALLAAGLSPWRLVAPLFASALAIGVLTSLFDDRVAVSAALSAERISAEHFHLWGSYATYFEPKRWVRIGDTIVHLGHPLVGGGSQEVALFEVTPQLSLRQRIDAETMRPEGNGRFLLDHVAVRQFDNLQQTLRQQTSMELELPGATSLFALAPGKPEMLPRAELIRQIAVRRTLGLPSEEQSYEAAARLVAAFAGCAGLLLAAGLALRPRRQGHLNASLVEGIAITGALWALMAIGKSLSVSGRLTPWLSASLPIATIAALGLVLLSLLSRAPLD